MTPLEWRRWVVGLAKRKVPVDAIATTVGGSPAAVEALLEAHLRPMSDVEAAGIAELYAQGHTMESIARASVRGVGTVWRIISRRRPSAVVARVPTSHEAITEARAYLEGRMACR